jgi:dTDP-4-dehydrorhamnose reductase
MRFLLLGKNGQVGWELQRALAPLGELIALGRETENGLSGNLEHLDSLRRTVQTLKPDIIVNAAAYTAVDQAESDLERTKQVNAKAPGVLAEEAARLGAWLVHYSTDYVFDGSGTKRWREDDKSCPLNVYGATKFLGEELVRHSGAKHLILRTQWIYATRGKNFIRTMLRKACEQKALLVINDQVGAPTGAALIADTTAHAIRTALSHPKVAGTYHLTARGEITWYDYARFIVNMARKAGWPIKVADEAIKATDSETFATSARRPLNSRLAIEKLERAFKLTMPDWRTGVQYTLTEIMSELSNEGQA